MILCQRMFIAILAALAAILFVCSPGAALSGQYQLSTPPLGERWFGILIDQDLVGFYRQQTSQISGGGYRIEGDGSVRMKVMGFSKESNVREVYQTTPGLALRSFEIEQTINGAKSRLTGKTVSGGLQVKREADGTTSTRLLKFKGELIPGPLLNLVPFFKGAATGRQHQILVFDAEELQIKEVVISVFGEVKMPEGGTALKLSNNLYPFVSNDIWVNRAGDTLLESVREGLVITRATSPDKLAAFISGVALSQKDLIYDFSLVRLATPMRHQPSKLSGIHVHIDGYGAQTPILNDGWQQTERSDNKLVIRTGSLKTLKKQHSSLPKHLESDEGIEVDAAEIKEKAKELVAGQTTVEQKLRSIASWTSGWLEDSVDDGGSALTALSKRRGNCQTHSKLYTALARAAGIPTRFVSGLVSQDGGSFLYHSWAESLIDGNWVAVDPTFNQLPADVTHLAFFEGNQLPDLMPLVSIIGKLKVNIISEK